MLILIVLLRKFLVLGGYGNTLFEIRRKDYLLEKRDFNGNRFADYSVPIDNEFNVEFTISRSNFFYSNEKTVLP